MAGQDKELIEAKEGDMFINLMLTIRQIEKLGRTKASRHDERGPPKCLVSGGLYGSKDASSTNSFQ